MVKELIIVFLASINALQAENFEASNTVSILDNCPHRKQEVNGIAMKKT